MIVDIMLEIMLMITKTLFLMVLTLYGIGIYDLFTTPKTNTDE